MQYLVSGAINKRGFYFGGARSKGFATLRNVPKLLFGGQNWAREGSASLQVRAELVRDISRSL